MATALVARALGAVPVCTATAEIVAMVGTVNGPAYTVEFVVGAEVAVVERIMAGGSTEKEAPIVR